MMISSLVPMVISKCSSDNDLNVVPIMIPNVVPMVIFGCGSDLDVQCGSDDGFQVCFRS